MVNCCVTPSLQILGNYLIFLSLTAQIALEKYLHIYQRLLLNYEILSFSIYIGSPQYCAHYCSKLPFLYGLQLGAYCLTWACWSEGIEWTTWRKLNWVGDLEPEGALSLWAGTGPFTIISLSSWLLWETLSPERGPPVDFLLWRS